MPPSNLSKPVFVEEQVASTGPILEPSPDPESALGRNVVRKLTLLLLLLATAGLAAWKIHANLNFSDPAAATGPGRRQSAGGDRAIPVVAAAVQQKTMPIYLTALGTVSAYYSVTIKSRVDGQLTAVTVREGQKVSKGQLLAQIDPSPYAAAVAQAEGQLAKDKAAATYATLEADRYTALYKAGIVSQDNQQTLAANAAQLAGAVQADKAAIQAARVNLDYTRITSPIDGVVGLRLVDPGNILHATDATGLLLVTQLQPVSVIFTLPEDQLPQVKPLLAKGSRLAVDAYDRSQNTLLASGKLLTLDNQIDTSTGTDKVKAIFNNRDSALFPNQFVNVRLILEQRPNTIVIPSAAVQTGSQGNFVYVVKKGDPPKSDGSGSRAGSTGPAPQHKHTGDAGVASAAVDANAEGKPAGNPEERTFYVELRPISVDLTEGTQVIVSNGLAEGEQVVIDGMEKLKNGSRVSPARDASKAGRTLSKSGDTPPADSHASAQPDNGGPPQEHHHHRQQS